MGSVVNDVFLRQRVVPGIGDAGQERLANSRVAIVGVGGLGCPAARYLAAAGVGELTLIDSDTVHVSNLSRQILFAPSDVGASKVEAAAAALAKDSPWCKVSAVNSRMSAEDGALINGHDVVIDATDTWISRRDVAAAARLGRVPLVWGAVQGGHGQLTVFADRVSLDDVFPDRGMEPLDSCEGQGAVGVVCGLVGVAMAGQAMSLILGADTMEGTLSVVDGRSGRWREVPVRSRAGASA